MPDNIHEPWIWTVFTAGCLTEEDGPSRHWYAQLLGPSLCLLLFPLSFPSPTEGTLFYLNYKNKIKFWPPGGSIVVGFLVSVPDALLRPVPLLRVRRLRLRDDVSGQLQLLPRPVLVHQRRRLLGQRNLRHPVPHTRQFRFT